LTYAYKHHNAVLKHKFSLNFERSIVFVACAALFELTHAGCMPKHRLQCFFQETLVCPGCKCMIKIYDMQEKCIASSLNIRASVPSKSTHCNQS